MSTTQRLYIELMACVAHRSALWTLEARGDVAGLVCPALRHLQADSAAGADARLTLSPRRARTSPPPADLAAAAAEWLDVAFGRVALPMSEEGRATAASHAVAVGTATADLKVGAMLSPRDGLVGSLPNARDLPHPRLSRSAVDLRDGHAAGTASARRPGRGVGAGAAAVRRRGL